MSKTKQEQGKLDGWICSTATLGRGFFFIRCEDKDDDFFAHVRDVENIPFRHRCTLSEGMRVAFDESAPKTANDRYRQARNISILGSVPEHPKVEAVLIDWREAGGYYFGYAEIDPCKCRVYVRKTDFLTADEHTDLLGVGSHLWGKVVLAPGQRIPQLINVEMVQEDS